MDQQPKLQQATRAADGSEIPLGISGIYRRYDDNYFYAANDGTKESGGASLRRKLAAEKATAAGDAALMTANDNDPEIDKAAHGATMKQEAMTPVEAEKLSTSTECPRTYHGRPLRYRTREG